MGKGFGLHVTRNQKAGLRGGRETRVGWGIVESYGGGEWIRTESNETHTCIHVYTYA